MAARGETARQALAALTNLAALHWAPGRLAYVGLEANSQGCRDMGVLPDRLPGHAALDDDKASRAGADCGAARCPTHPARAITDAGRSRQDIKALYDDGRQPRQRAARPGQPT